MRAAIYGWNMAVDRLAGWPRQMLTMRSRSRVYSFTVDAFPATFRSDLDGILKSMSDPDPLDPDALILPLRATTISNRRARVLRIASALAHSGEPMEAVSNQSYSSPPPTHAPLCGSCSPRRPAAPRRPALRTCRSF